jgi:N-methylhydantoinase B
MIRSANSVHRRNGGLLGVDPGRQRALAEEAGPPIQLNTVGVCLKTILEHYYPAEAWQPGDVIITNDPYAGDGSLAATHTNDYLAFYPLFFEGRLVAFSGLMVHWTSADEHGHPRLGHRDLSGGPAYPARRS